MTETVHPTADTDQPASGSRIMLIALLGAAALLGFVFWDGLVHMAEEWEREEYSHGYLIPVIAMFMVYQHRRELLNLEWTGTWLAIPLLLLTSIVFFVGELSSLYIVIQYAFIGTLAAIVLAATGLGSVRWLWVPIVYLVFMIPLPNFLYLALSQELQLISSQLGVAVIRAFGISVYLEGNVIDLGVYKLQVVEACSGLRYLFPLMSFGFLCAYLYRGPLWQRAVVFLSSIPLTVLMNSIRIGMIGVLVEHFGIGAAEGFLHYFEGWIIFMTCVAILFLEMWLFARFGKDHRKLSEVFGLDYGEPAERALTGRPVPATLWTSLALLAVVAVATSFVGQRAEIVPDRDQLTTFPLKLGSWDGVERGIEQRFINRLKFDDYILADFSNRDSGEVANLYVAWYDSQRKGASIHSPRTCIPGDGWEIENISVRNVPNVGPNGETVPVNRVLIRKGQAYQLVYYYFPQRGQILTNEYAVKWNLLKDALTRQRTDGALVRLTIGISPGVTVEDAERGLTEFIRVVQPALRPYLPD
ncbi:MAG: VPLPA-CTERM-specific exosortase XrtD [Pseudomonadota bacterium]